MTRIEEIIQRVNKKDGHWQQREDIEFLLTSLTEREERVKELENKEAGARHFIEHELMQIKPRLETKLEQAESRIEELQKEKEHYASHYEATMEMWKQEQKLHEETKFKLNELEIKFECGHCKIDWDDSYGNCVACTMKEYADKYDDLLGVESKLMKLCEVVDRHRDIIGESANEADKKLYRTRDEV